MQGGATTSAEAGMASSSFVSLDISFTIWWEPRNPNVIKMCTGDPRFVNDEGGRPGLWITFSSSPRSRHYNPAYFNRLARALADAGQPGPPLVS